MYKHEGMLAFGCGCQKNKQQPAIATTSRVTTYQVIDSTQTVVAEFATLQEARTEAVAKQGRVRVSSKQS